MNRFLTAQRHFEPPGRNELIVWKTDSRFFLSREARAVRAHKTLTPRVTDFFTDFEEKPTVLQSIPAGVMTCVSM